MPNCTGRPRADRPVLELAMAHEGAHSNKMLPDTIW